jgi:hypothetical protein
MFVTKKTKAMIEMTIPLMMRGSVRETNAQLRALLDLWCSVDPSENGLHRLRPFVRSHLAQLLVPSTQYILSTEIKQK